MRTAETQRYLVSRIAPFANFRSAPSDLCLHIRLCEVAQGTQAVDHSHIIGKARDAEVAASVFFVGHR